MHGTHVEPWSRKTAHEVGQLIQHGTTTEPSDPRAHAPQWEKPGPTRGPAPPLERSPHCPQLEKQSSKEDPVRPKITKRFCITIVFTVV